MAIKQAKVANNFAIGDTVELHSLAALNGKRGKVEGFRDDGRVLVKLPEGVKALKPMNLKAPSNHGVFLVFIESFLYIH